MVNVPAPSEGDEKRIRGLVEGYIHEHEREDDLSRVAGTLRTTDRKKSLAVIDKYRNTWENDPAVDMDRLAELEGELRE